VLFRSNTPLVEILGELKNQMDAGKFRYYGISNYSAAQTAELLKIADENNLPHPVIHQPPYSLLNRDIERDLIPLCEKKGIAVAPFQILQGGLLTGKYRRGQELPDNSRKAEKENWVWELTDELFDKLESIEAEAKAHGRTLMQHAVLAALEQPPVVSAVLGVKHINQLKALIELASS